MTDEDRLAETLADFDAQNARDPNMLVVDGVARPRELIDAERLSAWVGRLAPDASVALRLAARCQHLCRWELPRSAHAEGRKGYLLWRATLQRLHADRATETLRAHGWDEATVEAVRRIVLKHRGHADDDAQRMEDALCLAFLAHELEDFAGKHADDKLVDILAKTWRKMSEHGRQAALGLELSPRVAALVARATGPAGAAPTPTPTRA